MFCCKSTAEAAVRFVQAYSSVQSAFQLKGRMRGAADRCRSADGRADHTKRAAIVCPGRDGRHRHPGEDGEEALKEGGGRGEGGSQLPVACISMGVPAAGVFIYAEVPSYRLAKSVRITSAIFALVTNTVKRILFDFHTGARSGGETVSRSSSPDQAELRYSLRLFSRQVLHSASGCGRNRF